MRKQTQDNDRGADGRKEVSRRHGATMVMTVTGFFALISMVALTVDVGHVYTQQRRWQNAVDSASLAAYQQLKVDKASGSGLASLGVFVPGSADCPGSPASGALTAAGLSGYSQTRMSKVIMAFGRENGFEITDDMITFGADRVTIDGKQQVKLFVAPVLGLQEVEVRASQTVIGGKAAANVAATIPIAMPHGDVKEENGAVAVAALPAAGFTVGQEYIIKVGAGGANKNKILIPMDNAQAQHLLAYGVAYAALGSFNVDWLINYRGGSFLIPHDPKIETRLTNKGVTFTVLKVDACKGLDEVAPIYAAAPKIITCFQKPKIGVYSSQNPDPVMTILQQAEIPYGNYSPAIDEAYAANLNTFFFDTGIRANVLNTDKYDWLHLHHEDFTAGRLDIANTIRTWLSQGHHMYTQCFATETLDEALATDAMNKGATGTAIYENCLAFKDFYVTTLNKKGIPKTTSNIDDNNVGNFTLLDMMEPRCQNHATSVTGFGGATTSFLKSAARTTGTNPVTILATIGTTTAKYLWGKCGSGEFTFLAGHSQADLFGKRLVLNNILLGSQSSSALARSRSHFGPVELDPNDSRSGTTGYEDDFIFGNTRDIKKGDVLTAFSGNLPGQTRKAVALRANSDTTSTAEKVAANSARVVNVPLVSPSAQVPANLSAAQLYDYKSDDKVTVIGMAQFLVYDATAKTPARTDNGPVTDGQVRGVFLRYVAKP